MKIFHLFRLTNPFPYLTGFMLFFVTACQHNCDRKESGMNVRNKIFNPMWSVAALHSMSRAAVGSDCCASSFALRGKETEKLLQTIWLQEILSTKEKTFDEQIVNGLQRLENKFLEQEQHNRKMHYLYSYLIVIFLVLATCALLVYVIYRFRRRKQHNPTTYEHIERQLGEKDLALEQYSREISGKVWINRLYQHSLEHSKQMEDLLYKLQNHKVVRQDVKLLKLIEECMDNESRHKKNHVQFFDPKLFHDVTGISEMDAEILSDNEKMLLALLMCGLTNKEVATLTGSSAESIRKRRKSLFDKLDENHIRYRRAMTVNE